MLSRDDSIEKGLIEWLKEITCVEEISLKLKFTTKALRALRSTKPFLVDLSVLSVLVVK